MAKPSNFRTSIGGQALIEGIVMRGPGKSAAVVRTKEGTLAFREKQAPPLKEKYPILGWVFIRGAIGFVAALKDGMNDLTWSAEFYPDEEKEPSRSEKKSKPRSKAGEKLMMGLAVAAGFLIAIGLFTVLPTFIGGWLGLADGLPRNLAETGIRLVLMLAYMVMVSRIKDIQRTFAYHGAEHKTIACYEAGLPLTTDNVRTFSRFHPRCGTSFLLMVVLVSMLVFLLASSLLPFLPWDNPFLRVLFRLGLLPLVVSLSYEINRLTGRHDNPLTRFLRAPGLGLQRLTTREPDDSMIEVGIEALRRVIPEESGADKW